nr:TGF-beta receptor type-1 isoform 1 [Halisarca dujardinii]
METTQRTVYHPFFFIALLLTFSLCAREGAGVDCYAFARTKGLHFNNFSVPSICTSDTGYCVYKRFITDGLVSTRYLCEIFAEVSIFDRCPGNTTSDRYIKICCETDHCNNLTMTLPIEAATLSTELTITTAAPPRNDSLIPAIIVPLLTVAALLVMIALCVICFFCYRKPKKRATIVVQKVEEYMEEVTMTSGDGGGKPFLQQRTIAREIQLKESIGCGKYGDVYHGKWRGEDFAVKVFRSFDEKSWFRETQIYNQYLLPHENILGYMAADITSKSDDMTQLWLITHFHKNGSLYDYLCNNESITKHQAARLLLSTVQGVVHLHTEIQGAHKKKPAIAHRDIKSKNILVKSNGDCCIADFGMAVVQEFSGTKVNFPSNPRQGTKRYMAPEVLNLSINMGNFESFKKVDIYALGLVMWEICLQWETDGVVDPYQIPFQDMVQPDPSFEEMRDVVYVQKMRPPLPNRWQGDELLSNIAAIIDEAWHDLADARLTALRIRKNLQSAMDDEGKIMA